MPISASEETAQETGVDVNGSSAAFQDLSSRVNARYETTLNAHGTQLFTTDIGPTILFEAYLNGFSTPALRAHHVCNECRRFIERFGNLVAITQDGEQLSLFWNIDLFHVNQIYKQPIANMNAVVQGAKINGVFITDEKRLGIPSTGQWNHFAVHTRTCMIHKNKVHTAFQVAAEKREDYGILMRGLQEFSAQTITTALTILESDALYRAEKVIGPARWLKALQERRAEIKHSGRKAAVTWLAVASAPPGFCHPRSSMIGTLLEDIQNGLDFDSIKTRFKDKMNPAKYQRPVAAPASGNIAQAERIIAALGAQDSLRRRFATLADLKEVLWRPTAAKPEDTGTGVFAHLLPKAKDAPAAPPKLQVDGGAITWQKFRTTVLPKATKLQYLTTAARSSYAGFLAASVESAPPIFQWDSVDDRNQVSWYLYVQGSTAHAWNLLPGRWVDIECVTEKPSMWGGNKFPHHGEGVLLVLKGAHDTLHRQAGLGIFPETLSTAFREVRSTIELFSQQGAIEGNVEEQVAGILINNATPANHKYDVSVSSQIGDTQFIYHIDRWD